MKILITGCAGFIGLNFVNYWIQNHADDDIVGVDCFTYAANITAVKKLVKDEKIKLYKANICNENKIDGIFKDECPDIVVNFAAESHVDRSIDSAKSFIESNVIGVRVLLDACLKYKVKRFHQISTDEVYGDIDFNSNFKFTENSPLNPHSPYSASKAAADLLCLSYISTHNLPVTISRSSNNFGPYQHDEKLIPKTIKQALQNKSISVYGKGENIRDWIYVEDNCRAIEKILLSSRAGEIYNVACGFELSNIALINYLLDLMGKDKGLIKFVPDRKGHDKKYSLTTEKIKKELGFECNYNFYTKIKDTINWYLNYFKNC